MAKPAKPTGPALRIGDAITVRGDDRIIDGVVLLASSNQVSLLLEIHGMMYGHVRTMPLLRDEDGDYYTLLGHFPVSVTLREDHDV